MTRAPLYLAILGVLPASLLGGCVRSSTHEVVVNDLAQARMAQERLQSEMERELERRDDVIEDRERQITRLEADVDRLEIQLDRTQEALAIATTEVRRLNEILGQRGDEAAALQSRLRALAQVEQEIRERNRIYEEVLERFESLIDSGNLTVSIVRGRLVIQLPQDILFQSGSATLAADGRRTLEEVGTVLAELSDRRFQVEGHTDDVPISTERFPSNWELSSARATSVIRVLLEAGVEPTTLSAAGYGEYQPVASNDDPGGRAQNRRIEIVMLPNLDVIAGAQLP